ncbi:hypothetical protein MVEN_01688800 [Mycena venus]|uniref:Uncharacterized protein n=1 Tax=Mycena venus TaxID=2733690 RepID=A0A8H6XP36_9AGAR|nr:hypothetical protein MVEN_01688800 [Mycena venus]
MSDSEEHVRSSSVKYQRDLLLGILISGIVLCAMVLMAFAYTASQRRSRPYLHRVSFRLLVYAMVSNLILAVTMIPMEALMTGPISPAGCTFAGFASDASLLFSACMYCCMALNLQQVRSLQNRTLSELTVARLVLIHGVNGLMMEKYYVIGSSLLVAVCNIPPLAWGQLGFYDNLCWFSNPDPVLRFRWIFGTQTFWMVLEAFTELVCFIILMSYMVRRRMYVKRIRSDISAEMSALQHATYSAAPILQFRGIILRISTVSRVYATHLYGTYRVDDAALYPFLSCVLNFSGSTLDLYLARHQENAEMNARLNALDQSIFCARPFLYAVLAATDPSFLRAIRALRNIPSSAGPDGSQQNGTAKLQSRGSRTTRLTLYTQTLTDGSKAGGESAESMVSQSLDAAGHPERTEVDVPPRMHRDPEEGIERHSNVVEGCKDSIECQI